MGWGEGFWTTSNCSSSNFRTLKFPDSRLGMYALPWQSAAQQVVETTEVYFPTVLEVRSPRAKVFQGWFLPRPPSSACR